MDYREVYRQRMNRDGTNPTERINKAREKNFLNFLAQSPHRVEIKRDCSCEIIEGVLEPENQNVTKNVMHFLCEVRHQFKIGEICKMNGKDYMFYTLDEHANKGYNRWTVLEMSHYIQWVNKDGSTGSSKAYVFGQMSNMLKNEIKSRSRSATFYQENLKLSSVVMPVNDKIEFDSYFCIEEAGLVQYFRVTGFDFISTPGVMYVSIDPTLKRDLTPAPEMTEEDEDEDFFWLGGALDE